MSPLKTDFPAIRACIFDMDGLLINSEDIITQSTNQLLEKYSRPTFTRSIRAQLMGIPDSTNGDVFHNWAQLPISREQFARESSEQMYMLFPNCEPLPGAEKLLSNLSRARSTSGDPIELALASTLQALNTAAGPDAKPILPIECLVFEDSVIGVEAGRRAGMRVVWVPHSDLAVEYQDKQDIVLAGKTGLLSGSV
ncbi:hypothetical protein TrVGV298_011350 [Trichoderma virens]|nr:hypothetical protein TrVGV298_011350 [Trichoderma virens]